jgi:hypothetical protein
MRGLAVVAMSNATTAIPKDPAGSNSIADLSPTPGRLASQPIAGELSNSPIQPQVMAMAIAVAYPFGK